MARPRSDPSLAWLIAFVEERLNNPLHEHWFVPDDKKYFQVVGNLPQEKVSVANAIFATWVGPVWAGLRATASCGVKGCVKWDHLVLKNYPCRGRLTIDWREKIDLIVQLDPAFPRFGIYELVSGPVAQAMEPKSEAW